MVDFLDNATSPWAQAEDHLTPLGQVRPLRLTRTQFNSYEDPPGSGLYPDLINRPIVIVEGVIVPIPPSASGEGGGYVTPGTEMDTGSTWHDGKVIYQTTYAAATLTPGTTGANLSSSTPQIDMLIRMTGCANLASDGTGGWVVLGGSAFYATLRDDRKLVVFGPDSVPIYKVHMTIWYTKP
jgi:hypothetical protein